MLSIVVRTVADDTSNTLGCNATVSPEHNVLPERYLFLMELMFASCRSITEDRDVVEVLVVLTPTNAQCDRGRPPIYKWVTTFLRDGTHECFDENADAGTANRVHNSCNYEVPVQHWNLQVDDIAEVHYVRVAFWTRKYRDRIVGHDLLYDHFLHQRGWEVTCTPQCGGVYLVGGFAISRRRRINVYILKGRILVKEHSFGVLSHCVVCALTREMAIPGDLETERGCGRTVRETLFVDAAQAACLC